MHKAMTFEHGGKVYEVRAIPTLNGWPELYEPAARLATNCTPSAASTFKTVPNAGSMSPLSDLPPLLFSPSRSIPDDLRHSSRFRFRRPQCFSFRDVSNTRST